MRDKEIRIRFSHEERKRIQEEATGCGLSISEYVRKRMRNDMLIQKPSQGAVKHFQNLQAFKEEILIVSHWIPEDNRKHLLYILDLLLFEGKQII